ncbi:hypothetical protein C0Q70_05795 [Pomacea canaliculata]|uniref:Uncharacterized protein n=1 Tax=Pomacea canaliculata TaxID=400727 RepID=A0A2T7PM70_POMCA|nr:hypothetical protein C0Q70_05795 [Pomacea canaliculata]
MAMCKREEEVNVCVRMYDCVCTGMYVSVYLYTNDLKRLPTSMKEEGMDVGSVAPVFLSMPEEPGRRDDDQVMCQTQIMRPTLEW